MSRRTEHPLLPGNYAPVIDETTVTDLSVERTVTPLLSGRCLRIGNAPGPYDWSNGDHRLHGA
jgi:carotenoid cleavage oxygenase